MPDTPQPTAEIDPTEEPRFQVYWEERKTIGEQQFRTAQGYDKAILTVSAGAFALTPTLIKALGDLDKLSCKWLAVVGWGFLGLAVLATLFAMTASQKACMAQEQVIEDRYLNPACETRSNTWQIVTGIVNWVSFSALGAGLVCVATFAAINFL